MEADAVPADSSVAHPGLGSDATEDGEVVFHEEFTVEFDVRLQLRSFLLANGAVTETTAFTAFRRARGRAPCAIR